MYRFDEGLAVAAATNVGGTKAMLDLARELANLKVLSPVSPYS